MLKNDWIQVATKRHRGLLALIICCFVCVLVGCKPTNPYDTIKVSGQVTVDGVPVHEVNVTFSPASGNGQPGFGSTDAKGRYHLSTAGAPFQSGALAGEYVPTFSKVQLEERPPAKSAEEQIARDSVSPPKTLHLIPERYGHRDTCGLDSVTIKKGEKNVFDFKLTSE